MEERKIDIDKLLGENEEKHLNHPFYAECNQYRETVRREQVLKGAHKYPEPFNPFSWSPKQLLQHAMQENVDQGHYIYGLYEWLEKMEKEIEHLKNGWENEINEHKDTMKKWREDMNNIIILKEQLEHSQAAYKNLCKDWDAVKGQLTSSEMANQWILNEVTHLKTVNKELRTADRSGRVLELERENLELFQEVQRLKALQEEKA